MFFETGAAFRRWLDANHDAESELWVGFHRKSTGRPSIDWPELVDELLCIGWIDGLRKSIDDESWMIRITPRRPNSRWSEKNLRRFRELLDEERVQPAGLAAFRRREESSRVESEALDPALERQFRADPAAWEYFQAESDSYRRTVTRWVMSAKREETRLRRLETLIADSAAGRRIKEMRR